MFDTISLGVPAAADADLVVFGGVYAIGHSLGTDPIQAESAFEAASSMTAVSKIPYTATVNPARQVYDKGESVLLTGTVRDSNSGLALGYKNVLITVQKDGFERYISTTSRADGTFTSLFTPANGEAGLCITLRLPTRTR